MDTVTRIFDIARMLRKHEHFSATDVAEAHSVGVKTINRDMGLLRSLGWEIGFDSRARTYFLICAPKPTIF